MSRWICVDDIAVEIGGGYIDIDAENFMSAPSIDIVRCGECKAHNNVNMNPAHIMCGYMSDDDFCSYGKRSDDE